MSKEMTPKEALRGILLQALFINPNTKIKEEINNKMFALREIVEKALNSVEETNFNYHNALAFCEASKEEKQELYKQIKQLEKENQEIEKLYLNENKHWCETIDSLRKENQDLKEDLRLTTIERNVCENIYEALEEKYFKLEKIIEILKDKLNIRLHILTNTDGSKIYEIEFIFTCYSTIHEITQQEYDLLKELLENGGN